MNGLGIAHWLAGAAISAAIVNAKHSIIFHFDSRDRARLHAIGKLLALFLINFVHIISLATGGLPFRSRQFSQKLLSGM